MALADSDGLAPFACLPIVGRSLMGTALLALVYYLLVTPVGLVSRVVHDPLRRRWNPHASTYMTYFTDPSGSRDRA